jgi:hypothetical protein
MDSMMDAIKSHNSIKIQQLFENEHVVLQSIPMTSYCSGFDKLSQIWIPDDHANRLSAITTTGDGICLYNAVSLGIRGNKIIWNYNARRGTNIMGTCSNGFLRKWS